MPELDGNASSFGNIAIRIGYVTEREVVYALEEQEKRLPLGEIMVAQGSLTREQLEHVLHVQNMEKAKSLREKTHLQLNFQKRKAKEAVVSLNATTQAMRNFALNGKMASDAGS